jgi:regulator of sigma E protease
MNFNDWLSSLGQLPFLFAALVGLGFSIFVHELGHFLAARKRGLLVTRFSIGMGPKLWSWTRGGVEYRLGVLPIGGYVALPQLADMGRLEGGREEDPQAKLLPGISFSDKVIVSVMGAVFNFIFAFILAMVLWLTGQPSSEEWMTNRVGYVSSTLRIDREDVAGPAWEAGMRPGDVILEVDGGRVSDFSSIQQKILTGVGRDSSGRPLVSFKVQRGAEVFDIQVNPAIAFVNRAARDSMRTIGIVPASTVKVHVVSPGSPAAEAGLQKGDIIRSINSVEVLQLQTFVDQLSERSSGPALVKVERDGSEFDLMLRPETVALTKPLLELQFHRNASSARLVLRPDYAEGSKVLKTDPSSPASLVVHDLSDPDALILGKLRTGDRIIAVQSRAVNSLFDAMEHFNAAEAPVLQLSVGRAGGTLTLPLAFSDVATQLIDPVTQPMVGFSIARETVITHVNPFRQFGQQIDMTLRILTALFHRGSDISVSHLSGPIGIVRQLTEITRMDPRLALSFLILMNVNLGILNLLPIPILDGGHILFAVIGKLRRRELPMRWVAGIQGAFMLLLFSLMIFVLFKDSVRWHGDHQEENRADLLNKIYIEPVFLDRSE